MSSTLLLIGLMISCVWVFALSRGIPEAPGVGLKVGVGVNVGPGGPSYAAPMFGMNQPSFVRFSIVDAVTGIALNLAMLASGVGLLNLRGWGARLWFWVGLTKIVRLVVLWGLVYTLYVAPSLSTEMARSLLASIPPGAKKPPTLGDLTRVYLIMNLVLSGSMVVLGSIYPAASIWLLGRPGIKASLVEPPPKPQVAP